MYVWVVVFTIVYRALSAPMSANIVLSGGLFLTVILWALRTGISPATCAHILCGAAIYTYTALSVVNSGLAAPSTMWYASVPVMSMLLLDTRSGIIWTSVTIACLIGFVLASQYGLHCPTEVSGSGLRFLQFSGVVGLVSCVCMLVCVLKKVEESAQIALHEANRLLELQAATDGLTGISNRRGFDKVFEEEWIRHKRSRLPISLALIDTDLFKQYNDAYGHLAGDDCLRLVANVIQASIFRAGDFVARFGGEEFAIIMPGTDEQGAAALAERIRVRIKQLGLPHPKSSVSEYLTISIGLTTIIPSEYDSHLEFLREADIALYRAKANGRDQIMHFAVAEPASDVQHPELSVG
ncbi:MAG TPA: diguanylate cyclase [Pirellulales bacterium]|jgi:diguanylate cyclase (GGDEF)-like protein|nr:diguanylate cyclase [Pirellulales bacterium]